MSAADPTHGRTVAVAAEDEGARLDRWFRRHVPDLPHGGLERLLRTGQVRVDNRRAKAGQRLGEGQRVRVPPLRKREREESPRPHIAAAAATDLIGRVLHRDADLLVVDKPAGLAVQGGSGTARHLDEMLDVLQFDAPERPRLLHRLDKDTSGVLALARNARAAAEVARAFRLCAVRKIYWALTIGAPRPESGSIRLPLAKSTGRNGRELVRPSAEGRRAVTAYSVVARAGQRAAWLQLEPETGRTHQLRAHLQALGYPIVGDRKYRGVAYGGLRGGGVGRGLHLHARALQLPRPGGGQLVVNAELPPHMAETWAMLGFDTETTRW